MIDYNIKTFTSFNFPSDTFVKDFVDADGDSPCEVILLSLPDATKGQLNYNGAKATAGMCFPASKSNLLTFYRLTGAAITTSFNFKTSDNNQNKQYSKMATVTINISAYVNQAPSQVGGLTVTIAHAATKTFSGADFTTGLSPVYLDPEGDAPSKLKVLTLPISGVLKLSGVAVTAGQEISFASIQGGLFTYTADSATTTAINTSFTFSMSDTGSGLFTS